MGPIGDFLDRGERGCLGVVLFSNGESIEHRKAKCFRLASLKRSKRKESLK